MNQVSYLKISSQQCFDKLSFPIGEDETDGDTTDDDPLAVPSNVHQQRGSIVRLKKRDSSLYGHCPQTDPFSVVSCRHCRMVLKAPCLKSHLDRHRHEKDRKHDLGEAVVKLEKLTSSVERSHVDKTIGVTEKFDKISVVVDKYEKLSAVKNLSEVVAKSEKIGDKVIDSKRHRHYQRKSTTPSENSNDAGHYDVAQAAHSIQSTTESSSASNSPQPRRRKRKHVESQHVETFQSSSAAVAPTTCRIIVEPSEIVIRDASSPPPLALLSKKFVLRSKISETFSNDFPFCSSTSYPISNEPQPSVWIVTPSPAVIIDGSFVVKPIDSQDADQEIDIKDLKVLKPLVKETLTETPTLLTQSNWYANQPRPLAVNTFNMRKLNAHHVMATQRKLIELGRNLRTEEKGTGQKVQPKTWSFIERSQVFIPFRITH